MEIQTNNSPIKAIKKVDRSPAYPSINLETAIDALEVLKKAFSSASFNRENAIEALGYKKTSGFAARRVAALGHYGFLSQQGGTYIITPLANKVLFHTSDEDKNSAIREAAKTPKLFGDILEEFNEKGIPARLDNILIMNYRVNSKFAPDVVRIFVETMEYSGFIKNGVINTSTLENEDANKGYTSRISREEAKQETRQNKEDNKVKNNPSYSINLPSGIEIMFPEEMKYSVSIGEFAQPIKDLEKIASDKLNFYGKGIQEVEGK